MTVCKQLQHTTIRNLRAYSAAVHASSGFLALPRCGLRLGWYCATLLLSPKAQVAYCSKPGAEGLHDLFLVATGSA